MAVKLYVLCPLMEDKIFANENDTLIITIKSDQFKVCNM